MVVNFSMRNSGRVKRFPSLLIGSVDDMTETSDSIPYADEGSKSD